MDPLAVLAYGAKQALPLIGMEWNSSLLPELEANDMSRYVQ